MTNDKTNGGSIKSQTADGVSANGKYESFHDSIHFWGRLTLWLTVILTLALPLYFSFVLGYHPGWKVIFAGYGAYAALIGIAWVLEPVMYYPILGVTGTYIGFLAGNISNMCLPCAASAQNALGIEPGTRKAEIVATLAIAAASIVNIIILLIVIVSGSYLISFLPESITDVFEYILPAIFGGIVAQFAINKPAYAIFGFAIAIVIIMSPIPQLINTLLAIILTVTACLLWEKNKRKTKESQ